MKIVLAAQECVYALLVIGEEVSESENNNMMMKELMKHGLSGKLEKLQEHQSTEVYKENLKILSRFFEDLD